MHGIFAVRSLAALLAGLLASGASGTELRLERVTRSGFAMDMPDWQVETDEDHGADGRHVRVSGTMRVEVGWGLDDDPSIDTLDSVIAAMESSYGARRVERRVDEPPGQLRIYSLLQLGAGPWLAMTHVACRDAGVLVTITTAALQRERAERLHSTVLPTFGCRAAAAPRLVDAWPSSDLPHDFGVLMEGSPLLAHRDGRWMMISRVSPTTTATMARDPESARRVFATYGEAMGLGAFVVQVPATEIRNLSGPAFAWRLESPLVGEVGASAFACAGGSHGYIVFAGDDQGTSDAASLHALTARLGCPDLPLPSVLERPPPCEVGVTDLCDEAEPAPTH